MNVSGLYAYISDVSPEGSRTARIAIMDFVFFAGIAIGKGTGSFKIRCLNKTYD